MTLSDFLSDMKTSNKEAFAKQVGTSLTYLRLILSGARKPSISLCKRIERATENKVTRIDLRPDFFEDMPATQTTNKEAA